MWDADGHEYLDFLGEFTAGVYGHSDPTIRAAIVAALDHGINLSGHNVLEAELARILRTGSLRSTWSASPTPEPKRT